MVFKHTITKTQLLQSVVSPFFASHKKLMVKRGGHGQILIVFQELDNALQVGHLHSQIPAGLGMASTNNVAKVPSLFLDGFTVIMGMIFLAQASICLDKYRQGRVGAMRAEERKIFFTRLVHIHLFRVDRRGRIVQRERREGRLAAG